MKQNINLYQSILFPIKYTYTLGRMLIAVAALLVVTLVIWASLSHKSTDIEQQVASVNLQLSQQHQAVELYQQALQQRMPNIAIIKQFEQAQRDVIKLQQLQQYLTQRQQQVSQFYSPVLQHLNAVNQSSLWLTSFQLQQQQSNFTGISLQPVSVTAWLELLRQLDYFKGQHFSQVTMSQIPDETAVSFVLSARKENKL